MIIDFTITNFKSIKDAQTLSMLASGQPHHLPGNVASLNDGKIKLLRSAGIYGANASGKSNVINALNALVFVACQSGDIKDGDRIQSYEPCLVSPEAEGGPIEFEIEFIIETGERCLYHIAYGPDRIVSESLSTFPSRAKASIFIREEADSWETIRFGGHYKGGKKRFAFFPNNSYLSKAGNSADAPALIRHVFNYFRKNILVMGKNEELDITGWRQDSKMVSKVGNILSKIDVGITKLRFEKADISEVKFPDDIPDTVKQIILERRHMEPRFLHEGRENHQFELTEENESDGTIKLYRMLPSLVKIFEEGKVFLVDELEGSFHPHIAELIIRLFNDPKVNKRNAQLIFSTHNTNLMSSKRLRRDQIWLTEKTQGETQLFSLDEFDKQEVRMDSPFDKWYDDGRFGAIPSIDYKTICEQITGSF